MWVLELAPASPTCTHGVRFWDPDPIVPVKQQFNLSGNVVYQAQSGLPRFPVRAECAKRSYAFRALFGFPRPMTENGSTGMIDLHPKLPITSFTLAPTKQIYRLLTIV
jgi:hypothetical protein